MLAHTTMYLLVSKALSGPTLRKILSNNHDSSYNSYRVEVPTTDPTWNFQSMHDKQRLNYYDHYLVIQKYYSEPNQFKKNH